MKREIADDGEDDFALSSSYEAELLKVDVTTPVSVKREYQDEDSHLGKKIKLEDPGVLSNGVDDIKIKLEIEDDRDQTIDRPTNTSSRHPSHILATEIANKALKECFKLSSFRHHQEEVIVRLLRGGNAAVSLPPGGGKSLCFQVSALGIRELDRLAGIRQKYADGGISLVVSPFITTMKEEVAELRGKGIRAAVLNSPLAGEDWLVRFREKRKAEHREVVKAMLTGTLDILYVTPERLIDESFRILLTNVKGGVRLIAVDEAQRVCEQSDCFQRDYLAVLRSIREVKVERVLCLTATTSPVVAESVCKSFGIDVAGLFVAPTTRLSPRLQAASFQSRAESYATLTAFLAEQSGPTIVYVSNREHTEELTMYLRHRNFRTEAFHQGMQPEEKAEVHDKFMVSKDLIVVTVAALVEEIETLDFRNIIHYDIPSSLERYSQQIDKAGRDGREAQCLVLLCADSLQLRERMAKIKIPSEFAVQNVLWRIFAIRASNDPLPIIQTEYSCLVEGIQMADETIDFILVQLESQFGLMTPITHTYAKYRWKRTQITGWDKSPAALVIHFISKVARLWTDIDLGLATSIIDGPPRHEIVTKLYHWHDGGHIDLKPSGVVHRFQVLKQWPLSTAMEDEIFNAIWHSLKLQQMEQVVDLFTGQACFARVLAMQLDERLSDQECGKRTWCETKVAVQRPYYPQQSTHD